MFCLCITGCVSNVNTIAPRSSNKKSGLVARFYTNSIYLPPENKLNLEPNMISQENLPFKTKVMNNFITSNNTSDIFNINLNNHYIADIQGLVKIEEEGLYYFEMANDDAAILQIDGNELINNNSPNSFTPDNPRRNNIYLSQGYHSIRLMYSQIRGEAGLSLRWQKPNSFITEDIPDYVLFYNQEIENSSPYIKRSGIVGRFFDSTVNPPYPPLYPFTNKIFDKLDFSNPNSGDVFGIGKNDNFSAFFSGYLKLPAGYQEGNYKLILGSDDGATLSLNGIDYTNITANNSFKVYGSTYLRQDDEIPLIITYNELTGSSQLGLYWVRPDGVKEIVPSEALFH